MSDVIEFLCFVGGVVLMILCLVVVPLVMLDEWSCSKYEDATERPTKYVGATCYIQHDNVWYTYEEGKARFKNIRLEGDE